MAHVLNAWRAKGKPPVTVKKLLGTEGISASSYKSVDAFKAAIRRAREDRGDCEDMA